GIETCKKFSCGRRTAWSELQKVGTIHRDDAVFPARGRRTYALERENIFMAVVPAAAPHQQDEVRGEFDDRLINQWLVTVDRSGCILRSCKPQYGICTGSLAADDGSAVLCCEHEENTLRLVDLLAELRKRSKALPRAIDDCLSRGFGPEDLRHGADLVDNALGTRVVPDLDIRD